MKAYQPGVGTPVAGGPDEDELRIAVTFPRPGDRLGPTKFAARMSAAAVDSFRPVPADVDLALAELARRGFTVTARGELSASVRGSRKDFEQVFGTRLSVTRLRTAGVAQNDAFLFPADGAPWNPEPALQSLIDDAYIQWPHLYMASVAKKAAKKAAKKKPKPSSAKPAGAVSATPPGASYHHLNVPQDVARLLNATAVHKAGITGKGVRVVMIDSGFDHSHPFFKAASHTSSIVLAPRATNRATDLNGHGTGESANVFAVAPGVTFIGVKLDNDDVPSRGASVLEGFLEALKHDPDVISVSLGYDLRDPGNVPMTRLPNSLVALETEIQAAIARGIAVVFSAGNGHYAFPGQMPEVISAGGVYVDETGGMQASDYASAFASGIYSGRTTPDFCGLVGLLPHAAYIMLPQSPGSEIDRDGAAFDETTANDGWAAFSGTSAAAPQLAGVCALLLEARPELTPAEIKAVLRRTAKDVTVGHANPASDPLGKGIAAATNEDGATGAGLVDAFRAFEQVR